MLVVGLTLVVGCRSGAERDIVQRELRQQEDQIYALEDYLSEYQQLLCDARSENAALKRQMVKGQFREGSSSQVPDDANTLPSPPTSATTPPGTDSQEPPEPADSGLEVPPLDLDAPAVPPLDTSSENEPNTQAAREVVPASAEIEVVAAPPSAVVLRGEVQADRDNADTDTTGPRVLLNIEPVDAEGSSVDFRGQVSLLVLDPAAREKERQLARWDFSNEDLADMTALSPSEKGFEFPLQLPAESPTNRPLELWVRLLPEEGEKLLGSTTLDVSRSGRFASAEVRTEQKSAEQPRHSAKPAAAEMPVVTASHTTTRIFDTNVEHSGWQIAKPGEVALSQATSRKTSSEWKLATRPVPETESTPFAESQRINAASLSTIEDRYQVAEAPTWAPDRSGGESMKLPPPDHVVKPPSPAWAPTR